MSNIQYDYRLVDCVTPDGVLVGAVQYCPNCLRRLQLNDFPGYGETHWLCPSCGWWNTQELIECMMLDENAKEETCAKPMVS